MVELSAVDGTAARHLGIYDLAGLRGLGFSDEEIGRLLCGETVRGHTAEFSLQFVEVVFAGYLIEEHGQIPVAMIADFFGLSRQLVHRQLKAAMRKLRKNEALAGCLRALFEDEDADGGPEL